MTDQHSDARGPITSADGIAFPPLDHDHRRCVDALMTRVERLCNERRLRLTAQRRRILEIVADSHAAIGAYEILAETGRLHPSAGADLRLPRARLPNAAWTGAPGGEPQCLHRLRPRRRAASCPVPRLQRLPAGRRTGVLVHRGCHCCWRRGGIVRRHPAGRRNRWFLPRLPPGGRMKRRTSTERCLQRVTT